MASFRRVYYFTGPTFALENIEKKRLKVSRFSECNDLFELASFSQSDPAYRDRFADWFAEIDGQMGMLCFCKSWKSPSMWGRYAGNGAGVCYCFDVEQTNLTDVNYVAERLFPSLTLANFFDHVGEEQMVDLFATKSAGWSDEEEVRLLWPLTEGQKEGDLHFASFSEAFCLREVLLGPRSRLTVQQVKDAAPEVEVHNTQRSPSGFDIQRC